MALKQSKRRGRGVETKPFPYLSNATHRSLRSISHSLEPIIQDAQWARVRQEFPFHDRDRDFFDRVIEFYRLNMGHDTPRPGKRRGQIRKDLQGHAVTTRTFTKRMSRLEGREELLNAVASTVANPTISADDLRRNVADILDGLRQLSVRLDEAVRKLAPGKRSRKQKNEIIYYLMWLITMWVYHHHGEWIRRSHQDRNQDIVHVIIRIFKIADQAIMDRTIKIAAEKAVPKWAKDPGRFEVHYEKMATIIDPDYTGK